MTLQFIRGLVIVFLPVIITVPMKNCLINRLLFACSAMLLMTACGSPPIQETETRTPAKTVQAFHHKNLEQIFATHDYAWDNLDRGVPPLILNRFPEDLHLVHSIRHKKELFFRTLLPMAMLANEEIVEQRNALQQIFDAFDREGFISAPQQERLDSIQKRYKIKSDPLRNLNTRETLLGRVDIVPVSLVLAQAANESGWGTSRFARLANNIFGEWTFTPGTGLIPEDRPEGATYEVRRFSNLYQSVRSYMRNINTHRAYKTLRQTRRELRREDLPVSGIRLASHLSNYSTRREAYSREIKAMIRSNRLEQLTTRAYLRPDAAIPVIETILPTTGLLSSKEMLSKKNEAL